MELDLLGGAVQEQEGEVVEAEVEALGVAWVGWEEQDPELVPVVTASALTVGLKPLIKSEPPAMRLAVPSAGQRW